MHSFGHSVVRFRLKPARLAQVRSVAAEVDIVAQEGAVEGVKLQSLTLRAAHHRATSLKRGFENTELSRKLVVFPPHGELLRLEVSPRSRSQTRETEACAGGGADSSSWKTA